MADRFKSLAFTSLAHFTNDGTSLMYPMLITFYVQLPGIKIPYLGAMAIIFNLISGLLSTPVGRYADRTGRYGVMISIGITTLGISSFIFSLPFLFHSLTIPLLLVGAVFLGCGQAFYHPLGAAIIRNNFDRGSSPRAMGINGSFGSLGRAVMPTAMVFLMTLVGDFNGLIFYGSFSLVSAFILYFGLRTVGFVPSRAEMIHRQETSGEKKASRKGGFMGFVYLLTIAVFVRALFLTGTSTFLPTYLDQVYGSKTLMTTIIFIAYLLPVMGQPFFGSMVSRKGGKYTVVTTFTLSAIFFGLFLITIGNLALTILFFSLFAFAAFSGFPVFLGYVSQVVPSEYSGISNALVWGVGQTVGGALGAGVVTFFTLFSSVSLSIRLMFIFAIVSLGFLPFLPSRKSVETNYGQIAS